MSVQFNGTDALLEAASDLTGGVYPFAVFAWVRPRGANLTSGAHTAAGSGKWGAGAEMSALQLSATTIAAFSRNGSGSQNIAVTQSYSDTWYAVLAVFTSTTVRSMRVSGAAVQSQSTTNDAFAAGAHDRFRIGARPHSNSEYWEGDIAEVAVWSGTVPGATEFTSLSGGAEPETIMSGSLVFHATLLTHTALGVTTGPSLTTGGTLATGATHPISRSSPATAVTLTGPTSGTNGVASTDFTVGADGTITGDVVVTPSDGGDGGTFTPTTVTINSGSPTGTFTYTPASTGTKTISVTNDGGLTNPSSISYTSTAPNSAPSWSGTPSAMSAKRGQALTPQDITSLVSDADLDTLSYSITGAPTGVTINSSTGVISGTPTAAPGVYACTVEADDGIASPVSSSSFNITVTQCVLALNSAGYEFGDGNDPATMSVVASTELQVAAYPLTEWPPASAIATATATTGTNGRLADLGDDDLSFGTTYRVIARNAADGETWAWTMAAS